MSDFHRLNDKIQTAVYGYLREQPLDIPSDIFTVICSYSLICKILSFDPKFKATHVKLFDNDQRATKSECGQIYILAGGEAVKHGEHLWRLHVCSVYLFHDKTL